MRIRQRQKQNTINVPAVQTRPYKSRAHTIRNDKKFSFQFFLSITRVAACCIFLGILCSNFSPAEGKTRPGADYRQSAAQRAITHFPNSTAVEHFFRDFLFSTSQRNASSHAGPVDGNLMAIASHWNRLSSDFKRSYVATITDTTEIPCSFTSPSGHFIIHYAISGQNAVSPDDTASFAAGQNWRTKLPLKNGVPDYIDEVGWAFDSAWSMEVDRFGFTQPYASIQSVASSAPFHIAVRNLPSNVYGYTWYIGKVQGIEKGFASLCEVRNNWNGWVLSETLNYEKAPQNALRITAAHEFFHALQYGLAQKVSHYVFLDAFPITWIEATAVLMEEVGFDEVNDYLQYCSSFFYDPTQPLLDDSYDGFTEYKNSIIAKWLYEKSLDNPSIKLIKTVFDNSTTFPQSFYDNLKSSSSTYNHSWPMLFARFFAESFFTGTRSKDSFFIRDAALLPSWSYSSDTLDVQNSISKTVPPLSMKLFSTTTSTLHSDSAVIIVYAPDAEYGSQWFAYTLTVGSNQSVTSPFIPLSRQSPHGAILHLKNWSSLTNGMVVIANSDPTLRIQTTVSFFSDSSRDTATLSASMTASNNPSISGRILIQPTMAVYGTPQIRSPTLSAEQEGAINLQELENHLSVFQLDLPLFWYETSRCSLFIIHTAETSVEVNSSIRASTCRIYRFRENSYNPQWVAVKTAYKTKETGQQWSIAVEENGVYGLFSARHGTCQIFPNPVLLHKQDYVYIDAPQIKRFSLYTIDGSLITTQAFPKPTQNSVSKITRAALRTTQSRTLTAGTYITQIEQYTQAALSESVTILKLLIVP
ncbi:MAG: hypothetical protein JW795_19645 [Chitinivibrionales bacterium]|nr:hypothetical protein [Chitinivibrionales bacterium]